MRRIATTTTILFAGVFACAQLSPAQTKLKPKSNKEGQAFNAIIQAQDPDSRIKAADALITNFADTDFKSIALYLEAEAYVSKGDAEKAIVYAEQSVEADPKSYQALVLLAKTYASTTHVNDLDKEEKLKKTEKFATDGIEALKTAEKPNSQLTDAQWTEGKNDLAGQCYLALGIVATYRNKLDDAAANFQKVSEMDPDPTDLIRAGRALMDAKKYEQSLVWFDKAAALPQANAQVKQIAASDKARAQAQIKK
jgi:tetratricopeptide (TPR) repeat protein